MYDTIIIWAGSAGYPAWMYASRYKLKNIIIWAQPGWALATSHKVENYPGVISAPWKEIMDNFKKHAEVNGSEILHEMIQSIEKDINWNFIIKTNNNKFISKTIILATWNNYRHLWVPWENKFLGKWVSYCATCDGMFFKDRDVVIVWWWNTALTESLYLADICKKVYIIHRSDNFRAENIWVEQVKDRKNIELITNQEVKEIKWSMFWVENILLKSWKEIKAEGIFIAIWSIPNTKLVDHFNPKKDSEGCLIVNKRQETTIKWVYAAWDVTTNSNKFKQTIMSAAEGCLAANSIHEDLLKL